MTLAALCEAAITLSDNTAGNLLWSHTVVVDRSSIENLIVRHMVKSPASDLDRTFAALVDPTRRAILARLEQQGSVAITELSRPFAIKLPAVMKHLDVLADAGLITRTKTGRTVAVELAAGPMEEAMHWLRRYERFWSARLDRLAAYAEALETKARAAEQPTEDL